MKGGKTSKAGCGTVRRRDVASGVPVSPAAPVCAVCGAPLRVVSTSTAGRFWFIEVACSADAAHTPDGSRPQ